MALLDDIRQFWDDDAPTYDDAPQHRPRSPMVQAAWLAAMEAVLPPPPARVLDCGAGTGFLSLIAARLGHRVTAVDLSEGMLERLRGRAGADGLDVETVLAPASDPPVAGGDGYDAVMERHLLWTLPDPGGALAAWRAVAKPDGRLILVESLWGQVDPIERARASLRRSLRSIRRVQPEHHGEYDARLRGALPLGQGTHPSRLAGLVTAAGWPPPRLRRLADVEWAERCELPMPERLVGVAPRFVLFAR
jgi:SAM-dependent methyltransferase